MYNKNSINKFNNSLQKVNWNEHIKTKTDPNLTYSNFLKCFCKEFDTYLPVHHTKTSRRCSPRNEWITPGVIKCCNTKSKLYKKFKINPSKLNENIYKNYRNKLKKLLNVTEQNFYAEKVTNSRGNLKQIWDTLNMLICKKKQDSIPLNFTENDILYTNNKQIAEKFNEYFVNIGPQLAPRIPSTVESFSSYL